MSKSASNERRGGDDEGVLTRGESSFALRDVGDVKGHVSAQNDADDRAPELLELFLGECAEYTGLFLLGDLECGTDVVGLEHGLVVVPERQGIPGVDEERISDPT